MNTTWAFLISVADYDDAQYNLPYVHNDNAEMKKGLIDGLKIAEESIIICGHNGYVRYDDYNNLVKSYQSIISADDRLIVYYSGHGGGAPFQIKFSDVPIQFDDFCAMLEPIQAYAKIFIIDSCHSGNGEIPGKTEANPSNDLLNYGRSGFAIFASCNEGTKAYRHPGKDVSLYTYCFSEALNNARINKGKISLTDVAKYAALEADYIAKQNGASPLHPVYKCNIPGDVLFEIQKQDNDDKETNLYSSKHEHYMIYSTKQVHSSIEMRYSAFAIAYREADKEQIALYSLQIAKEIWPLQYYRTPSQTLRFWGQHAKVIFIYWGLNEEDIIRGNWKYRSVWIDPVNSKNNTYGIKYKSKTVENIWIDEISYYKAMKQLYAENSISDEELVAMTHAIADPILKAADNVVQFFTEYENGLIPEYAFICACSGDFKTIANCYYKMSNLPIPSKELKEWADGYDALTATIDDMRLFYTAKEFLGREENNRKMCMSGAVKRYHDDLQKLIVIETKLKNSGTLPCQENGQ